MTSKLEQHVATLAKDSQVRTSLFSGGVPGSIFYEVLGNYYQAKGKQEEAVQSYLNASCISKALTSLLDICISTGGRDLEGEGLETRCLQLVGSFTSITKVHDLTPVEDCLVDIITKYLDFRRFFEINPFAEDGRKRFEEILDLICPQHDSNLALQGIDLSYKGQSPPFQFDAAHLRLISLMVSWCFRELVNTANADRENQDCYMTKVLLNRLEADDSLLRGLLTFDHLTAAVLISNPYFN